MNKTSSLYIHFPYCRHLCNYCDFYKSAPSENERKQKIVEYENYLSKSFAQLKELMSQNDESFGELKTLYIGGGTPSLWGSSGAKFLQEFLEVNSLKLSSDVEATLEVNPGGWTDEGLRDFQQIGFNRFSLGVQSTRDEFLEKLDRIHRKDEVLKTLKKFQDTRSNFSVDFMLGLPFSEELERDIIGELEEILSFGPSHVSLYILTVKDNYKYYKNLPSDEFIEEEFLKVSHCLQEKGFEHYEVSNFALKDKRSVHNSLYWKGESVAALGPSATGYSRLNRMRYKWKTLEPVMVIENLSVSEEKMEKFYLGFRTSDGVLLNEFFENDELLKVERLAQKWVKEGFAQFNKKGNLCLVSQGFLVMDFLIGEIFSSTKSL